MNRNSVGVALLLSGFVLAGCDSGKKATGDKAGEDSQAAAPQVDEATARAAIEKVGGKLVGESAVVTIHLEDPQVTDDVLVNLSAFPTLKRLYLGPNVTDAGLAHLAGLSRLERIYLPGSKVTDAGLANLASLTRLQNLDLTDTEVTDAGVAALAPLVDLKLLILKNTKLTDAAVPHLQVFVKLDVMGTKITPKGADALRTATKAEVLR